MSKKIIVIFILLTLITLLLFVSYFSNNVTIRFSKNSISNTGLTIIITDKSKKEYSWGTRYFIQVKQNNEWKDLEPICSPDDPANVHTAFGYTLDKNHQITQTLDWHNRYGELSYGTYRVVKIAYKVDTNTEVLFYSQEFKIK